MKALLLFFTTLLVYVHGEKFSYTIDWIGPWSSPISKRVMFERVGAVVTMTVDSFAGVSTSNSYVTTTTATRVPSQWWPVNTQTFGCIITNKNSTTWGTFTIGRDGVLYIGDLYSGFAYTPGALVGAGRPSQSQTFTYNTLPFGSQTIVWSGPITPYTKAISFSKQGSMVTATLDSHHDIMTNYSNNGTYIKNTSPVPQMFRPQVLQTFKCLLRCDFNSNNGYIWGVLRIDPDGYFSMGPSSGPYPREWLGTAVGFGQPGTALTFTYTTSLAPSF